MQAESRNHHIDIEGKIIRMPLEIYVLREFTDSYVMLANLNMQEEQTPWASIMAREPNQPHAVPLKMPAVTNPIWLTEE